MKAFIKWFKALPWLHAATQMFIVLDQAANVFFGNPFSLDTWADETISSRCGRKGDIRPYKYYRAVIDWVFEYILRQGPNHCHNAFEKEKTQYHFAPSMRSQQGEK